jgi:hypothetical protein
MAAKKTDQKTLDLIKEVKARKAEISRAEKPNWKTNCSFSWVEGSSGAINIHVQTDIRLLISMAAHLHSKANGYLEMACILGVENQPPFTWNGYPTSEWIDDIKARIDKVQIATKKAKLEALESRLNMVISPELRAEMELEAIAAELK